MELRVNGEVRQNSTTANMVFKIPQLIALISKVMTIQPGDIIATGTPAGSDSMLGQRRSSSNREM
jgi:2-keto-4-pentenoate hydratase/2-oxohepta-3-ene-1,7-dioic acid hydratase in catechol pathway